MYRIISFSPALTGFVLYVLCVGILFVGREFFEGLPYNISLASQLGDLALICCVVMAADILRRPGLQLENFLTGGKFHLISLIVAIAAGMTFHLGNMLRIGQRIEWMDTYHNLFIFPLLVYLLATTLPIIWLHGEHAERVLAFCMLLICAGLLVYDIRYDRLNQQVWLRMHEVTWPHRR